MHHIFGSGFYACFLKDLCQLLLKRFLSMMLTLIVNVSLYRYYH